CVFRPLFVSVYLRPFPTRRSSDLGRAAGCALSAGDQVPRRQVSAQAVQAAGLRTCRAQWAEGLSRRGGALAAAVREPSHPELLRSEEHTSELQSHLNIVCRLLLEK